MASATSRTIIRPRQIGDVERIAVVMSEIDRLECRVFGYTPWQGLHMSVTQSALVWTQELDGWPVSMFGITPTNWATGKGAPWLLGSDAARTDMRAFLVEGLRYTRQMEQAFPRMENWVHARNTPSHRWLKRLGFVVEQDPVFVSGEPMLRFHKGF